MNTDNTTLQVTDLSLRKTAIITGIALLLMAILAPIGYMNIIKGLIVNGDAQTTAQNIMSSTGLFRLGILFLLINAVLDIVVAWGLYILLKPVNKNISLLTAWLRVTYAAILVIALNNLLNILQLLNGSEFLKVFETKQIHAQVLVLYNSFQSGWDLGLILFSIHLVILGFMMIRSNYIPKIFGILITIAGFGYLTDGFAGLHHKHASKMFHFLRLLIACKQCANKRRWNSTNNDLSKVPSKQSELYRQGWIDFYWEP